jgi:hypothetical protein
MKYLIILVIVSGLFLSWKDESNSNSNSSNKVSIILLDKDTNEKLVGVKNKNDNSYSNFDGELLINKNSVVSLELISYNNIQLEVKNDTIIKLSKIK